MSTVMEIKEAIDQLGPIERQQLTQWLLERRKSDAPIIHPDVLKITGLIPAETDVETEYSRYISEKHQ